jgi:histidine triad (HIT) family protein
MNDCIFCKIASGKIPSSSVFENEQVLGFKDLHPQAPIHLLFIHKKHTNNINELVLNDPDQLNDLFNAITIYTQEAELEQKGFRIVTNLGAHAGQTVFHTHLHVLGGAPLGGFGA